MGCGASSDKENPKAIKYEFARLGGVRADELFRKAREILEPLEEIRSGL